MVQAVRLAFVALLLWLGIFLLPAVVAIANTMRQAQAL
jgi:hypothetical protein